MSWHEPCAVTILVGSDRVQMEAGRIIVDATEPMDWPVREFCKVPICFEGRRYYVRSQGEAKPPFARRYELWLWPHDLHETSTRAVFYDEAYVIERNEIAKKRRRLDWIHSILLAFYPFLGLCWSGFKNRVLVGLGFEPRSITEASIVLIFNLLVVEGIFVGWLRGGLLLWLFAHPNLRSVDLALTLVLALDSALRYSQSLKLDLEHHWGFCEWLWPRRRREK